MLKSELHSIHDSYLVVVKALSTVALPSSGPIRDAFAVLEECVTRPLKASRVTIENAVRDLPVVDNSGAEELAGEPPAKRVRVHAKEEDEPRINEESSATEDHAQVNSRTLHFFHVWYPRSAA